MSKCFTKASNIFIDSYIYPLLLNESSVQEIQITLRGANNQNIPVIVNIKQADNGFSYWSFYVCTNRDQLQNELLNANEKLEQQSQILFELASTDPLTGLLNRRELQVQVEQAIKQSRGDKTTFALLILDVDLFKQVNDTYGHQVGDKVLASLATLFKSELRTDDLVSRYGGEEFVLLLQNINEENAFNLAEKLRKTVAHKTINNVSITVSVGLIVTRNTIDIDFNTIFKLADDALYQSKQSGRNRTSLAQLT